MSHRIGAGRAAVEQDSASFAIKRTQIEDIRWIDWSKLRCHKKEMIPIGQERRPTVRPFLTACIKSGDTLWCSSRSGGTLVFYTGYGENDYIRPTPAPAPV